MRLSRAELNAPGGSELKSITSPQNQGAGKLYTIIYLGTPGSERSRYPDRVFKLHLVGTFSCV